PSSSSTIACAGWGSGTVEERDHGGGKRRRDVDVVVGQAGKDRQPVLGHPRTVPAGVVLATPEQFEKLDSVRWRYSVRIPDHEHDRHRQAGNRRGPVVIDLQSFDELSDED